jgi:hypothetical protein
MVYHFQRYQVFGLYPSSLLLKKQSKNVKNTTFRKLDLFPYSGEGNPTLLGPLERASLSPITSAISSRAADLLTLH